MAKSNYLTQAIKHSLKKEMKDSIPPHSLRNLANFFLCLSAPLYTKVSEKWAKQQTDSSSFYAINVLMVIKGRKQSDVHRTKNGQSLQEQQQISPN